MRGSMLLTFDFRGQGRSEGEQVTMGYFERLDLRAALDCLAGRGVPPGLARILAWLIWRYGRPAAGRGSRRI